MLSYLLTQLFSLLREKNQMTKLKHLHSKVRILANSRTSLASKTISDKMVTEELISTNETLAVRCWEFHFMEGKIVFTLSLT